MEIISIQKQIVIPPNIIDLDKKTCYNNIENIFIKKYLNYCNKQYGYILEIKKIKKIGELRIDESGYITCDIYVNVKRLKPVKGMVLSGVVEEAFTHGLFIKTDLLQVLIPLYILTKMGFCYKEVDDNNQFFQKNNKCIKKGDSVNYIITNIKYEKKNYSCIGKLKID